jgi:amino acid transporter
MIGAGIFALAGSVANFSGSWAPLVIASVGLALLPVVLVFAALAGLFDETGGPILYVGAAFGPMAAFQTGWLQSLSTAAATAANANLLADYVMRLGPFAHAGAVTHAVIVLAAITTALAINLLEASRSAAWIKRISVAKLLPLALLLVLALPSIGGSALHPATEWSLSQAVLLSVYAFTGFEGGLCIAGEARDPRRDFPRALVGVFLLVVVLYALLAWGYVATAFEPGKADKASLLTMATVLAGSTGAVTIVITAALSILGSVTVNTFFVSRRLLALERIPALPAWFGAIRTETGLPRNAILFTFFVIVALAMSGGFTALAVLSVAARLLVYLACTAALPVIRVRRGLSNPLFVKMISALAVVTCLLLVAQSEVKAWLGLAIAVVIGFAVKWAAAQNIKARIVATE